MRSVSATVKGAGALPGCTNNPGAALRAVTRPVIGLGTTSVGSAARLAMMRSMSASVLPNKRTLVAPRAQIAFRGLMIGCRLIDVALRHGERLVQFGEAREIARGQFQYTRGGNQGQFCLQQVGAIDGEEGLSLSSRRRRARRRAR